MEFVFLEKLEYSYTIFGDYKSPIYLLGQFLTDEIGSGWPSYIKWLNNPKEIEVSGNITWLEKWNDNILIGYLYDSEENMYKDVFTISKDELLKVIDKWNELYNQKPNFIKITSNNDKITLEAKKQVEDIEYLKLQLNIDKYSIIETSKTKIIFLGSFLINDFQANPKSFIDWINDLNSKKEINGNFCKIRKGSYQILINKFTYNDKIINNYDNTFFIKSNHIIEILNKLHELFNQKVKEINIIYRDDIYTIEAID